VSGRTGKPGNVRRMAPLRLRRYAHATVEPVLGSPGEDGARERKGRDARQFAGASAAPAVCGANAPWFRVLLDARPLRTPAAREMSVPREELALAIAAEWAAQDHSIDPETMPLTKLANSAIDGVCGREHAVRADIAKYAGSDLVCYRADKPEALVVRQRDAWDCVLAWAEEVLSVRFRVGQGLMPLRQPEGVPVAIIRALEPFDHFGLAALHVMTTLTGSALLALACARGRLSVEAAWAAAHVDEDFQIGHWGEDAEARARRARQWRSIEAAHRMLTFLNR